MTKAENYKKKITDLRQAVINDVKNELKRLVPEDDFVKFTKLPQKIAIGPSDLGGKQIEGVELTNENDLAFQIWNDFTGEYETEYDDYLITDQLIFILNQLEGLKEPFDDEE